MKKRYRYMVYYVANQNRITGNCHYNTNAKIITWEAMQKVASNIKQKYNFFDVLVTNINLLNDHGRRYK